MTAVEPGLGRSATRGAAVTMTSQAARIVVQLSGIVLLARLLDPAAYGVVAMVLAITAVGDLVRDFGLSAAAVQARTVLPEQKNNLFWINTGIGAGLMLLVAAGSGLIAAFYDDARLQPVALVLALAFLFNGVATQFRADLSRRMRFGRLAAVDIAGQVGGITVGLAAALSGWGYWALVAQQVTAPLLGLLVSVAVTGWLPGLPRRGVPMRDFLSFGGGLAAVQVLGYGTSNADSVVIGATAGAPALGLYNRAFQLMTLPLIQINAPAGRVALPVLARLQDDPERFAAFLRTGQVVLLNVCAAILGLACAQAGPMIDIALGRQWAASAPLFQILAVAGFFQTASYAAYWAMLARGQTAQNLRLNLIARPVMLVIILGGVLWGVTGVAVGVVVAQALMWPFQLLWLRRLGGVPVLPLFLAGIRTLIVYAVASAVSWAGVQWLPQDAALPRLLLGGVLLLAALVATALTVAPFRRDALTLLGLRRHLGRRRRPALVGAPA